jgi:hypothetical protein
LSNFTITAESVIDTVIQDGQVQTTNRTQLLNYVNRVHMRMLRESQWLFLRSTEQRFITQPDTSAYWIANGSPPPGVSNTGLGLTDVASIIPDYVFDLTNARRLTQDSQTVLTGPTLRYKDGSYRSAQPRTFRHDYNVPGVLNLFPPPDNNNQYVPIPQSPVADSIAGGVIAWDRLFFVEVTIVDSIGNESVPCLQPTEIVVPSGNQLQIQTPSLDIMSASQVTYPFYNVYLATSVNGPFYLQNSDPIDIGSTWTEPTTGFTTVLGPSSSFTIQSPDGTLFALTVNTDGTLVTTSELGGASPGSIFLTDTNGQCWVVTLLDNGQLVGTSTVGPNVPGLVLIDSFGHGWQLGVTTLGNLTTTVVDPTLFTRPAPPPPQTSTLTPLLGYVISFYYMMQRQQITATTDILQIPYQYFDVVVAGVNFYANLYTAKMDDEQIKTGVWKREFMDGMAQMRRDLRINFRNTDVIGPDNMTQYQIGTQTGYSYYTQ